MARSRKRNHYGKNRKYHFAAKRAAKVERAKEVLNALGARAEQAAKDALKDGVDMIVAEAKARCPVYSETIVRKVLKNGWEKGYHYIDKRMRPGQLRDSINAKSKQNGEVYELSADATTGSGTKTLYYGQIVEFSPRINRPFLSSAINDPDIQGAVKAKVIQALRRAVK